MMRIKHGSGHCSGYKGWIDAQEHHLKKPKTLEVYVGIGKSGGTAINVCADCRKELIERLQDNQVKPW